MSRLSIFAFFVLLSTYALAQTEEVAAKKIDSLFASYTSQTPGAAVAIVKDGKVIFKKGYGMANLDHDVPITPQTVFNTASVSKQFTAFAIYLLKSEGKLSFNDDVRKYIPELPDYGANIRIKHLLAHTSGLRDQAALLSLAGWNIDGVTTEQILKLVTRQTGTNFTPGTAFNYNNTGYTLLAEVVHRVTGKPLSEFAAEKIFRPLGMSSTLFYDNHERIIKNKAESYEKVGNVYHHKPLNVTNPGPSNLLTTVEDLSKWVLNFERPVVGTPALIKAFNEPSYLDNGQKVILRVSGGDTIFHAKGQNVSNNKGITMISHGGHAAAFRTYMGRFPDQRFAIIALSNDEHNESLNARWQLADLYLKGFLKEEPPSSLTPSRNLPANQTDAYRGDLREFEGEYYSEDLSTSYQIRVLESKLVISHQRISDIELKRVGANKFSGSGPQTFPFEMEFTRNTKGTITGYSISNFGVKNLQFIKIK